MTKCELQDFENFKNTPKRRKMEQKQLQASKIGKNKLPTDERENMTLMWRKNGFRAKSFHKTEKPPPEKQDTYQNSHAPPGSRLTFLCVYAMIMAYKYGGNRFTFFRGA